MFTHNYNQDRDSTPVSTSWWMHKKYIQKMHYVILFIPKKDEIL